MFLGTVDPGRQWPGLLAEPPASDMALAELLPNATAFEMMVTVLLEQPGTWEAQQTAPGAPPGGGPSEGATTEPPRPERPGSAWLSMWLLYGLGEADRIPFEVCGGLTSAGWGTREFLDQLLMVLPRSPGVRADVVALGAEQHGEDQRYARGSGGQRFAGLLMDLVDDPVIGIGVDALLAGLRIERSFSAGAEVASPRLTFPRATLEAVRRMINQGQGDDPSDAQQAGELLLALEPSARALQCHQSCQACGGAALACVRTWNNSRRLEEAHRATEPPVTGQVPCAVCEAVVL